MKLILAFLALVSPAFLAASELPSQPLGRLPILFEPNSGQFGDGTDFVARGPGYVLAMRPGELLMSLKSGENRATVGCLLIGANPEAVAAGEEQQVCRMSYFLGNDPANWRTDVPTYGRVRYAGIYPGVDLVYYGNQREIEYDFVVSPGADPGQIAFRCDSPVQIDPATGELVVSVEGGELRHRAPVAYQESNSGRETIPCRYELRRDDQVAFALAGYDRSRALVIDPILSFSTYFGGIDDEVATAMAVDSSGYQYLAGNTDGNAMFTGSNLSRDYNGGNRDCFVVKMRTDGTVMERGTLIGGSGEDEALAIAVDPSGNVYLAGTTNSLFGASAGIANTMPHAAKPGYDRTPNGGLDAFVVKINAAFSAVDYSTFLGGADTDAAHGIAVTSNGRVWVAGTTSSASWDFPSPASRVFDTAFGGGTLPYDGFLVKLDTTAATGQGLEFFSYIGGTNTDEARGVALDSQGNAAVTGFTYSSDFPMHLPLQAARAGGADAFLTRFSSDGSTLLSSTFLGGSESEFGEMWVAFDSLDRPYITGSTRSADFPVANAAQPNFGGGVDTFLDLPYFDIFVARLNASASAIQYATFIGGNDDDEPSGLAVDSQFNAYISGVTASSNFPINHGDDASLGGTIDGVLIKLNADGNHINYSTFLGGIGRERAVGLGIGPSGSVYVGGWTQSSDFGVTPGALQTSQSGSSADMWFRRYTIGNQKPVAEISAPIAGTAAHLSPFTGTVSDDNVAGMGVRVQVIELNPAVRYWNGAAWQNAAPDGSGPWLAAQVTGSTWQMDPQFLPGRAHTSPGTYTLRARAEDADGNLSDIVSRNVVRSGVDTTPPQVTFTYPATEGQILTTANPALDFTVTDPETNVGLVLVSLRKFENGVKYWDGTIGDWVDDVQVAFAEGSGGSYSFPNPPSGAKRPNANYELFVSAANLESPPLTDSASIGFSVDFYPTYTWTGLNSNLWFDPGNWASSDAPGTAPGMGANVVITYGSPTIPGGETAYLNLLQMWGSGTLNIFGSVVVQRQLNLLAGTINGLITLAPSSSSYWETATILGTMNIQEGALLTVRGSGSKWLGYSATSGTINNAGTILWDGEGSAAGITGFGATAPATINNQPTGVIDIAGDGSPLARWNNSQLTLNNDGRIVKSAGSGISDPNGGWIFNVGATSALENAVAGSRLQPSGVTNLEAGAKFRGPGMIAYRGGSTLNAPDGECVVEGGAIFDLDGAELFCPAGEAETFSLVTEDDAELRWSSGYLTGNLAIPAGITWRVVSTGSKWLGYSSSPGAIHNAGIIRWDGAGGATGITGFGATAAGTINNLPLARFYIEGDGDPFADWNSGNYFHNHGRIIKSAGSGTSKLPRWDFTSYAGSVIENAVGSSILERGSGLPANLAAGTTFYGPGIIRLVGGATVNAGSGSWNIVGGAVLDLAGMTLNCPQVGSLSLDASGNGQVKWLEGYITGNLTIPAGVSLEVAGPASKWLGYSTTPGTIHNAGIIRWDGLGGAAAITGFGATAAGAIDNLASGQFVIHGDGEPLADWNAGNYFYNHGRIIKTGGTGTSKLPRWDFTSYADSVIENAVGSSILERGSGRAANFAAGIAFHGPASSAWRAAPRSTPGTDLGASSVARRLRNRGHDAQLPSGRVAFARRLGQRSAEMAGGLYHRQSNDPIWRRF
ncbi:MAG: SBBP repeat-containing protein [Verrucomicrobiales bacterium]